ncbi:hypothetical protein AVEN_42433-1 [Araneus ventricosus]|uniref:Uncharacterized protein n=1 Tax=Araneus ventricosus TaxID=182803 RepID=A0A4Y2QDM6_ARAVE|nr:hypothetical protein AVEN_42433-1 [Araneus ventricosus]
MLSWEFIICPKTFFPPILVEKLGKAFTDVPKFVLRQGSKSQNSCNPDSSSSTWENSSFISSLDARFQCAVGNEEEGTSEDKDAADEEEQERLEALREAEERRKEKHRKMEEEREKMRQEIRDKVSSAFSIKKILHEV